MFAIDTYSELLPLYRSDGEYRPILEKLVFAANVDVGVDK